MYDLLLQDLYCSCNKKGYKDLCDASFRCLRLNYQNHLLHLRQWYKKGTSIHLFVLVYDKGECVCTKCSVCPSVCLCWCTTRVSVYVLSVVSVHPFVCVGVRQGLVCVCTK